MEHFKSSWINDERYGWALMKEEFDTPIIDAPIIFSEAPQDVTPDVSKGLAKNDYILYKDHPAKITQVSDCQTKITVNTNSREDPHTWELKETDQDLIEQVMEENMEISTLMRVNLNVILNTNNSEEDAQENEIVRQGYININEGIQKNTQRIKTGQSNFKPVMIEIFIDDYNFKDIDKEKKFFQNSNFTTDMVINVLQLTREDIQHVQLFKEVAFKPQEFIWNTIQALVDIRVVGFGVMGAYQKVNLAGAAKCTMKIQNNRTKQVENVQCNVIQTDFDIHSYFMEKPIFVKKGDPLTFNPVSPLGQLYEISSDTIEFCGSDGNVFKLACSNNSIAMQYYY